jgi:hypothetical protein
MQMSKSPIISGYGGEDMTDPFHRCSIPTQNRHDAFSVLMATSIVPKLIYLRRTRRDDFELESSSDERDRSYMHDFQIRDSDILAGYAFPRRHCPEADLPLYPPGVGLYESSLQLAILVLKPLGWLWLLPPLPFLLNLIWLSPFWWDFAELSPILP